MADQGMDYLPDWRDLAWPTCPECGRDAVDIWACGETVQWRCSAGHRWTDEEKEAERAR